MGVTDSTLSAITTGYNVQFRQGLTAMTQAMPWMMIANETTSTDATTVYPIKGRAAKMREWKGARVAREHQIYGYSLPNKKFEDTILVQLTDIEDDKYALYNSQMQDLGAAAGRLPYDEVVAAVIAGDSTACYDGEYFFDTDHPQDPFGGSSTTWSNDLSSQSLTAANVQETRAAMQVLKDADGTILGVNPTHIIVPAALQKTAEEIVRGSTILQSVGTAGTDLAATAPSNVLAGQLGLIVIPELDADSATTWYMADLSKPVKPLFWQWRVRPEFQRLTRDSQHAFEHDAVKFGARARGAAGYALPQLMFRCAA